MHFAQISWKPNSWYFSYCFSILFDKPDDKLMRMAKVAIALHCSGSLVEYAIVSAVSLWSVKFQYVATSSASRVLFFHVFNHVLISQMMWRGKMIVNAGHLSAYYGDQSIEHLLSPPTFRRWYLFWFYPTQVQFYGYGCNSQKPFWDLTVTDVTLADEDTNSIQPNWLC